MKEALIKYFNENNVVIKITGFLGVIASLFLQITNFENNDLKIIQVFLLLLFGISILYLLIDLIFFLFKYAKEFKKDNKFFIMAYFFKVMAIVIIVLIFSIHFFKFIISEFNNEIVIYFKYYSILLLLFVAVVFDKSVSYIFETYKFKNKKIKILITEWFFSIITMSWVFYLFFYMDKKTLLFIILFYFVVALEEAKIIRYRVLFLILFLISLLITFNIILHKSLNI